MSESGHVDGVPVWYLYMIETASGALYTGITTDVERRFREHQGSRRGARALRGKGPLRLVHRQAVGTRSEALKLEAWLKQQPAQTKHAWLQARQEPDTQHSPARSPLNARGDYTCPGGSDKGPAWRDGSMQLHPGAQEAVQAIDHDGHPGLDHAMDRQLVHAV